MEIALKNASRKIGRTQVLDDISLNFPPGQITAIIGRNGAGKTSFLRALAGHLVLDSGKLLYGGQEFSRDNIQMRRSLMALFEFEPKPLSGGTAAWHTANILDAYGMADSCTQGTFAPIFETLGLTKLASKPLHELSRGNAYRALLAPLFLSNCTTLLLDEPFAAGLDAAGTESLKRLMRDAKNSGQSLVYSTQLPEQIEGLGDRAILIEDGKIAGEFDEDISSNLSPHLL